MGGRHRIAGHGRTLEAGVAGWHVWCRCGWTAGGPAPTKRAAEARYAEHRMNAVPICAACQQEMPGRSALCAPCRTARTKAWAAAHPERFEDQKRRSWLKRKYDITPEQYDELLVSQNGVCAICARPPADPRGYAMHVDHDHATGTVRGILCGRCNRGIGQFDDDPVVLAAAVDYLRRSLCAQ